ncbi:MAG: hypothetical protein ACD_2C00193G0019 [uncultured bacterium (gcode 4)]|uniref:Ankyrin repeat protein n=1 Tax=uncultured bacterium (gcode 4) TaxID=1234023 RepID=K2G260_9BACT|nr:MAG: hypothetical protein ACD_2C00193G0019 [uncultured bacterium (gcode 4)]
MQENNEDMEDCEIIDCDSIAQIIGSAKSEIKTKSDHKYILMDFLSENKGIAEAILRWNSLDATDSEWKTILHHLAIHDCNPKLISYLLEKWVNRNITDSYWKTAYDYSVFHERSELSEILS